ncbi:hypothetical protein, partial [Streptomyces kronopolitis]
GGALLTTATTNTTGVATGTATFNTAGTATVTATVLSDTTSTCACTGTSSAAVNITVQQSGATCSVVLSPPAGTVNVGVPTALTTTVLCNGAPVAGASVAYTDAGGALLTTATTNTTGVATGTATFNTAGTATVTAVVTFATGACQCTGVRSAPISIAVNGQTGSTLRAAAACWRVKLPIPLPNLFTATLRATVTPPAAGIPVSFTVQNQVVGTATTDVTGNATLDATLTPFQIIGPVYTAVANIGTSRLQANGILTPCLPPV